MHQVNRGEEQLPPAS